MNDLDNATLHIDGQSTEVDATPDIIDVPDEDDDIINDEDTLPHDLADSDDEDLMNVDDDGVDKMSADVARSHGGDGDGEDRPPPHHVPTGCGGCFANRGKGKRKPNLGGRAAGRLNTRDKTRNLSLKEITDKKGPVPIRFEVRDKQTLMPLGDHAAHWSSYIGEVIRGVPLYYPSWLKVPKERKAALITDIGTQFDLRPHMESPDWTEIDAGIQQHLQKAYNTNKAAFKAQHWVIDPETGTYNVEKIRRARPEAITAEEWDKYIQFWNDPRNIARAAQNRQNRAKSTVISRQGSRSLARLRDEMRQSSATQEYPSLIDTFFVAHTVNGEFTRDEDRLIYEEMRRLEATGTYTDDEINRLARRGKQRGHIPGVVRVFPARVTAGPSKPAPESMLKSLHKKVDFMMSLFNSDSEFSDAFSQFESVSASGSSESGGCRDDEESADDQEDEDEDGDGDS
ncbi:F-box domain containing protein [Tanacetum coccineum]